MALAQRNPYGLEQRVEAQFKDIQEELNVTVQLIKEHLAKAQLCLTKETHEILPLVVQLNQGPSGQLENDIRESNDEALSSLNQLMMDQDASMSQGLELSNNLKDLVVNGYSVIEEQHRNHLNKVAIIIENLSLTLNQKFSTLAGFYVKSMLELKSTWLALKTQSKTGNCCFKVVPIPDRTVWLHQLGYYYVASLNIYPDGWPDELNDTLYRFLKKTLRYVAYYRDTFDLLNINIEIQRVTDLADGYRNITTLTEFDWMNERVLLLTEIRDMYRAEQGNNDNLRYMRRIANELPCFIKGEEKAPLIYCHEHIKTLVDDIKNYVGSEVGVRACTEHMNEIKRAGFAVSQFECVEKKSLSTDEPVYYLRINTSV